MPRIALSELKLDDSIYPRASVNDFNVAKLIAAMKAGAQLPAIVIVATDKRIVDGRHRYEAYLREGLASIEAIEKSYASEADVYADAVRLNVSHGQALTPYNIRNAIIRLEGFGYAKDAISDIVKLPLEQIEQIERGFAVDATTGEPVALKGGLAHLGWRTTRQGTAGHQPPLFWTQGHLLRAPARNTAHEQYVARLKSFS
jgi:ParB-like chromosome segregation protein Spo0J